MGCVIIHRGALRAPAGGQRPPLRRSPTVFSPPVSLTADSPLIRGGQRNASTKKPPSDEGGGAAKAATEGETGRPHVSAHPSWVHT